MYYHICIEAIIGKNKHTSTIREIDISDKERIINEILIPYLKNEEFFFRGYTLKKSIISRLYISKSDYTAEVIANNLRANYNASGLGLIMSDEDIVTDRNCTTEITSQLLSEARSLLSAPKQQTRNNLNQTQVFIVHGHDNEVKLEVARFIERLGLTPIILHEQANDGMTIIEKIEKYSNVGYGIVLFTPCDIGYSKEDENNKKYRARQNVVFEHGYLIGKLGRKNVSALVKGDIEKPNDISGVVYIPFDDNEGWKMSLAKDMKSAGYNVDLNLCI